MNSVFLVMDGEVNGTVMAVFANLEDAERYVEVLNLLLPRATPEYLNFKVHKRTLFHGQPPRQVYNK